MAEKRRILSIACLPRLPISSSKTKRPACRAAGSLYWRRKKNVGRQTASTTTLRPSPKGLVVTLSFNYTRRGKFIGIVHRILFHRHEIDRGDVRDTDIAARGFTNPSGDPHPESDEGISAIVKAHLDIGFFIWVGRGFHRAGSRGAAGQGQVDENRDLLRRIGGVFQE